MLLALAHYLEFYHRHLNVFNYLTFRAILSALTAFLITLGLGPLLIRKLIKAQLSQPIRQEGPQSHLVKSGTPTMGGVLMIIAIVLSVLLWGNLNNRYLWLILLSLISFGGIGFYDDYLKLILHQTKGLTARQKLFLQLILALLVTTTLYFSSNQQTEIQFFIPFCKKIGFHFGLIGFVVLTSFVIIGASNGVNLTDGLDGLAILPIVMVSIGLGVFAYLSGHLNFANYLFIPYLPGTGELVIFCSAVFGAGLGFLWFNTYPAQIFMGDVGSLGLGACLGVLAVIVRQELILMLMGGIFVFETLSVILQIGSYRLRGKKLFKMAPFHHHLELSGWPEPRIIVRFWIITCLLVLLGLSTLKLR